jgi:hypothetical protein
MSKIATFLLLCTSFIFASAQPPTPPVTEGKLSSTRLLSVQRLKSEIPDQGPDGMLFCFLVARTPVAQHNMALKETRDFAVGKRSYQALSRSSLGRVFEPQTAVHDAAKYALDHPEVASAVAEAPPRSVIITSAISGPELKAGDSVEIVLHVGFGRTPDKPEAENLVFTTTVPAK